MINKETFESFNARYISHEDIAETFIVNSQYEQLITNNHTLLMGPRGSGKTTLLKMLTPPCQNYFKKNRFKEFREIGFIGVYVPTDIQWQRQIEIFAKENLYPKIIKENFPKFLVTTNVIICLINTFKQLIDIEVKSNEGEKSFCLVQESELSKSLIQAWDISKPVLPTLDAIKQSLYQRLKDSNNLLKRIRYEEKFEVKSLSSYYYDDYYDLVLLGCEAFEAVFREYKGSKWALCFDELEISPEWLQQELLQKLRSTDQRFLFKLTTSPIVSLVNKLSKERYEIEAREDEDFRVVRTWNYNLKGQRDWNKFAENLVEQKFYRRCGERIPPQNIFGNDSEVRSLIKEFGRQGTKEKKEESLYGKNNYYWLLFKNLALVDQSFKNYLESKKINPGNPLPNSPNQMDQVLRKVLQIAFFRYQFRRDGGSARSRKNPAIYYGVPTIYDLCDGNPRFLIALTDSLLLNLNIDEKNVKLNISRQSMVIKEFSDKYLNLIASHPDSNKELSVGRFFNLSSLIEKIGYFFYKRIVMEDFKMDVYTSFTVDFKVPDKIIELIELGVHLGAFIYLDPIKVVTKDGLKGEKLRLSYLLHPFFNLPKREYNSISLSRILKDNIDGTDQLTIDL